MRPATEKDIFDKLKQLEYDRHVVSCESTLAKLEEQDNCLFQYVTLIWLDFKQVSNISSYF